MSVYDLRDGTFPSLATLAADLGVNEKTVRRLIDELKAAGFLETKRRGWGKSNRYILSLTDRTPVSNQEGGTDRTPVSNQEHAGKSTDRTPVSTLDRTPVSTESPVIESPVEKKERKNPPISPPSASKDQTQHSNGHQHAAKDDAAFERFWSVYPKRVEKLAARAAFDKAIAKAPADVLIGAAERYATERQGQDRQYTKHPTTWLNRECWNDEPAPRSLASVPARGTHPTGREIAMQKILERRR